MNYCYAQNIAPPIEQSQLLQPFWEHSSHLLFPPSFTLLPRPQKTTHGSHRKRSLNSMTNVTRWVFTISTNQGYSLHPVSVRLQISELAEVSQADGSLTPPPTLKSIGGWTVGEMESFIEATVRGYFTTELAIYQRLQSL